MPAVLRLAASLVLVAAVAASDAVPVIPRVAAAPTIDGALDDPCWAQALTLSGFTAAGAADPARTAMRARLCCTDRALFIAVTIDEPASATLRAVATGRAADVWKDDCVEVFLRAGADRLDYDQFITNANGAQEDIRCRGGTSTAAAHPGWRVASARAATAWTVEFAIPASDLDLDALRRGDLLALQIGREDRTAHADAPDLAVWPAKAAYGPRALAPIFVESDNLVVSPDGVDQSRWGGDGKASGPALDGGVAAWRFTAPAHLQQEVRLRPGRAYRMSFDAKASAAALVRIRAPQADPRVDERIDLPIAPSAGYVACSRRFTAGPQGKGLLVVGVDDVAGGPTWIRGLRVAPDLAQESTGAAIPVPSGEEPLVVTKLRVADARIERAFCGSGVDGTTRSFQWDGGTWEYCQSGGGAGVNYAYLGNNGYHIAFADRLGFQAVVIRGGARAKLYRDVAAFDDAKTGSLVYEFPGGSDDSRAYLEQPVVTDRVSFFDVADGRLADCSFFRVRRGLGGLAATATAHVAAGAPAVGDAVARELKERFADADRATLALADAPAPLELPGGRWVHVLSRPLDAETGLAALGVDLAFAGPDERREFSVRIQDPLDPRLELHGADYVASGAGRARIVCDFPDQIVPQGAQLWISLRFARPVALADLAIQRYDIARARAAPEALAYRRFLLRSLYVPMSEPRPWNGWWKDADVDAFLASRSPYVAATREILDTIAQCRSIDPDDDLVRQYDQWIHQNILRHAKRMPPFPTRFDAIPGVPEWASLAHQAWMQAREVPRWWLDHRLVASGEIGGEVQDDTDMFGNYAPFPFFERDGVGGMVLDAGRRLAETAERNNLERGWNKRTMDPLHAYEEGMNHESIMSYWNYGDPVYVERCMVAARGLEHATVLLPNGHRHFKRADTGAIDAIEDRSPEGEEETHFLMTHPALEAAWYNHNARIVGMLREYAAGWVAHQTPGSYAASVKLPEDTATSTGDVPFPALYGMSGSAFMAIAEITGDRDVVRPYLDWIAAGHWTLHVPDLIRLGMYAPGEGDRANFDAHWQTRLMLRGDKGPLIDALKADIEELQRFAHMYTAVECFTDRVFMYPVNDVATAYTGAYSTRNKLDHPYAVSWDGFGTDYAALVLDATADHLKALVCNLSDRPLSGRATVWRLEHGRYDVTLAPDADGDDRADAAATPRSLALARGDAIDLALPARSVQVLEIRQTAKLDDLFARADLALSALETTSAGGTVTGKVHNLGNRPAEAVVALVDPAGHVVDRVSLGAIEAPLDLNPRAVAFTLPGVPEHADGWSVVVDPDDAVPEICEGNNRVSLGGPAR